MNAYLQPAYLLHSRAYRETSLLLELLTKEFGRVGLVARGARRSRSNGKALLQPFQPLIVSWRSRGELGTLTAVERKGITHALEGNRIAAGFYINELIYKLIVRDDPNPNLYVCYDQAVRDLSIGNRVEVTLRRFEKKLLDELGYGLILDHEVNTGSLIESHKLYHYQMEAGPIETRATSATTTEIHGATLLGMLNDKLETKQQLMESKHLLRAILQHYLGNTIIRSRELIISEEQQRS